MYYSAATPVHFHPISTHPKIKHADYQQQLKIFKRFQTHLSPLKTLKRLFFALKTAKTNNYF
jgi:hypothetical protein